VARQTARTGWSKACCTWYSRSHRFKIGRYSGPVGNSCSGRCESGYVGLFTGAASIVVCYALAASANSVSKSTQSRMSISITALGCATLLAAGDPEEYLVVGASGLTYRKRISGQRNHSISGEAPVPTCGRVALQAHLTNSPVGIVEDSNRNNYH